MKHNRLYVISSFLMLCFILIISQTTLNSHPNQPDAGYVNDPDPSGALTCANSGCHSGTAIADSTMFTVKMGLFSAGTGAQTDVVSSLTTYHADSVYYITVTGNGTSPRYGFELTVVDAAATPGNMAGVIALTNTTNTTLGTYQPNGSTMRQYAGHKNATTIGTTHVWTFKWTAPGTGRGPLTIYYCGMNSNANGNQTGDVVYKSTRVIAEEPLVINGIGNQPANVSAMQVYPTAFSNDLTLSFNMEMNAKAEAELMTMNGTVVSKLMDEELPSGSFNRTFQTPALASGIYLVRVHSGNATLISKVIKL